MILHTRLYNNSKYSLSLRRHFKDLYSSRYSLKGYAKNKANIDCMLYNMIDAIKKDTNIIILTTKNTLDTKYIINGKVNKTGVGVVGLRKVLSFFEELELIEWHKGYKIDEDARRNGYIVLTPKLIELILGLVDFTKVKEHHKENVIVLRDKNKKDIEFRLDKEKRKMIKELKAYNKFMSDKKLLDGKGNRLDTNLTKIYSEDFQSGGRLYGEGYTYQQLPSAERLNMTLDGSQLCEIDIRASHISILYSEEGLIMDKYFDPYNLDNFEHYELDGEKFMFAKLHVDKDYQPIRNLIKLTLMVAINAKSRQAVKSVIRDRINKDNSKKVDKLVEDFEDSVEGSEEHTLLQQELYSLKYYGIASVDLDKLLDAVCNKHKYIKEHFFSGVGIRSQKIEGDIFLDVMVDCMEKGIEIIPVHDSALCKEEHFKYVTNSIERSWLKYVGVPENLELKTNFNTDEENTNEQY